MQRLSLTNALLLVIAVLLAVNALVHVSRVRAASPRIQVQKITVRKTGTVDVNGEVVGFSCAYMEGDLDCAIASR
jgi:hypothetical protein